MSLFWLLLKYLPFWAVPIALLLIEAGIRFRKRGRKALSGGMLAVALLLIVLAVCFFVFRWENLIATLVLDSKHL